MTNTSACFSGNHDLRMHRFTFQRNGPPLLSLSSSLRIYRAFNRSLDSKFIEELCVWTGIIYGADVYGARSGFARWPLEILIPVLTRDHLPDPVCPERLDPCSRFPRWSALRNWSSGLIQITLAIRTSGQCAARLPFVLVSPDLSWFLRRLGTSGRIFSSDPGFPDARTRLFHAVCVLRSMMRRTTYVCTLMQHWFFLSVANVLWQYCSCNIVIFGAEKCLMLELPSFKLKYKNWVKEIRMQGIGKDLCYDNEHELLFICSLQKSFESLKKRNILG